MSQRRINRKTLIILVTLLYGVYFIGVILMSIKANTNLADDKASRMITEGFTLIEWIKYRYETWSARVVQEGVGFVLIWHPTVWRVLFAFIMCSTPLLFFFINHSEMGLLTSPVLFLLYPINEMSEAGWICTTNTYLEPAYFALLACAFLYADYHGMTKHRRVQLFLFAVSIIIASDHELMAAYLLMILIAYFVSFYCEKHQISTMAVLGLILNIANIVFILLSPGNQRRMAQETTTWFPGHAQLNLIEKMIIGLLRVYAILLENSNTLFVCLCVLTCAWGFIHHSYVYQKIVSFFPLLVVIIKRTCLRELIIGDILVLNDRSKDVFIASMLVVLALASILMTLYWTVDKTQKYKILIPATVLIGGVSTIIAMGLSPTIYASGHRTEIFMYFGIIYLTQKMVKEVYELKEMNRQTILAISISLILVCVALSANNVIFLANAG